MIIYVNLFIAVMGGQPLWVLEYTVVSENSSDLVQAKPGLCGKIRPGGNCLPDLLQNLRCGTDAETVGHRKQIIPGDAGKFSVYRHQVLAGPFALGIMGVRHIVGRGKLPFLSFAQDKEIFLVWSSQLAAITLNAILRNASSKA